MCEQGSITVLGIGGSTRSISRSQEVTETALTAARAYGAHTAMWSAATDPLPFYDPDAPLAEAAERFIKAARTADAFIWCTPAYHGSVSAPVKNLLDYLDVLRQDSPPFLAGKVVGVTAVGDGAIAPVQATSVLVQIAHALQATVVPLQVPIGYAAQSWEGQRIIDGGVLSRLAELGRLVVATASRLK